MRKTITVADGDIDCSAAGSTSPHLTFYLIRRLRYQLVLCIWSYDSEQSVTGLGRRDITVATGRWYI